MKGGDEGLWSPKLKPRASQHSVVAKKKVIQQKENAGPTFRESFRVNLLAAQLAEGKGGAGRPGIHQ